MAALAKKAPPATTLKREHPAIPPDTPAPAGWRWGSQESVQPGIARLVKIGIAGSEERYYRLDPNATAADAEKHLPRSKAPPALPDGDAADMKKRKRHE